MAWDRVVQCLEPINALCDRAIPLTAETHQSAVKLSRRHGYRIYNSQILAAALRAGCETIYTEDMQHGQVIEGLRIENPFAEL